MSDKITLKPETETLTKLIQDGLKIDKSGAVTVEENLYAKTLPEGVTIEQVAKIDEHNTLFAAAALNALGNAALPVMKKNANIEQVAAFIPTAGKSGFDAKFVRDTESRNPKTNEITKGHGGASIKFDFYGTGSRGELKKVKSMLADKAAAALA